MKIRAKHTWLKRDSAKRHQPYYGRTGWTSDRNHPQWFVDNLTNQSLCSCYWLRQGRIQARIPKHLEPWTQVTDTTLLVVVSTGVHMRMMAATRAQRTIDLRLIERFAGKDIVLASSTMEVFMTEQRFGGVQMS